MAGSQIPPNQGPFSRPTPGGFPSATPPMPGPDSHRDMPIQQPGPGDSGPPGQPTPGSFPSIGPVAPPPRGT